MRYGEDIIELPRRPRRCRIDVEDVQTCNVSATSLNSSTDSIDNDLTHNRVISLHNFATSITNTIEQFKNKFNRFKPI